MALRRQNQKNGAEGGGLFCKPTRGADLWVEKGEFMEERVVR